MCMRVYNILLYYLINAVQQSSYIRMINLITQHIHVFIPCSLVVIPLPVD